VAAVDGRSTHMVIQAMWQNITIRFFAAPRIELDEDVRDSFENEGAIRTHTRTDEEETREAQPCFLRAATRSASTLFASPKTIMVLGR
jgi:hypothetical protein